MANLPFTLRQLDVFATLCRSMSFRQCADELRVSQAAVSNQIKTLETQLGVPLFVRTPGFSTRLTAEGSAFLSDLRECERALGRLAAHRLQVPRGQEQTRFRILIAAGLMDRYVKPKLDGFIANFPGIDVKFVLQKPTLLPSKKAQAGKCDFALFHIGAETEVTPTLKVLATLKSGLLGHVSLAAGRSLPLSAEETSNIPMVMPPEGSVEMQRLLSELSRQNVIPRNIIGHTEYFEVMVRMIERGSCVASLPMAILPEKSQKDVTMLFPVTDWKLVWHRKPGLRGAIANALEHFITSAVLDDPSYFNHATCSRK